MTPKRRWRFWKRTAFGLGIEWGQIYVWDEPTGWWIEIHFGHWALGY